MAIKKRTASLQGDIQREIAKQLTQAEKCEAKLKWNDIDVIREFGNAAALASMSKEAIEEIVSREFALIQKIVPRDIAYIQERVQELQAALGDTDLWERSLSEPVLLETSFCFRRKLDRDKDARLFLFQDCVYAISGHFTKEQENLLVQDAFDSERRKFERLKHKFDGLGDVGTKPSRLPIPEDVRIVVWRRDGGCCARCKSRERLEYDHIIPVSRGGGNTPRNIELLCEACNRSKSNHIQ